MCLLTAVMTFVLLLPADNSLIYSLKFLPKVSILLTAASHVLWIRRKVVNKAQLGFHYGTNLRSPIFTLLSILTAVPQPAIYTMTIKVIARSAENLLKLFVCISINKLK